jgi:hypothetical protein
MSQPLGSGPPTAIIHDEINTIIPGVTRDHKTDSLRDREERVVAALLTRFKNLVSLAAMPTEDGATKEVAATQAFQMEVESAALVCFHWSSDRNIRLAMDIDVGES